MTTDVDPKKFMINKKGNILSITSPYRFYLDPAICELLGLEPCKSHNGDINFYHKANETVIGNRFPKLRAVDVIEIHCNLAEHSFVNHDTHWHKHDETEILYHFFPNVPHGYKISEVPQDKLYVPLKSGLTTVREIKIMIKDQDNQLIVNDGVVNIVYLSLIKV